MKKRVLEEIGALFFKVAACASVASLGCICVFIMAGSLPTLTRTGPGPFLFGLHWKPLQDIFGIFPMLAGSVCVTGGALVLGAPPAILLAVFMTFFCPRRMQPFFRQMVGLMAAIPSVVYGFFALVALVPVMRLAGGSGKNMLTASLVLAIMILPTITSVSEAALRATPPAWRDASLALGATLEQTVFKVMLPGAASGIWAGIILGLGRALGETMAVIMVAGNQPQLPSGLLSGVRTLTANIVLEMGYAADAHRDALIATSLVLFVFILLVNLSFAALKRQALKGK